ncbi:MAG TPA: L-threonylcarbamoyladenylate synthase [Candidatus Babeliales bacterium]|jgi:L-threonylcarbamoyladenylate synthase|nr:L-threonylcarbamoyladenylate synthase [Candidatus Babeliales bacterium]
MRTLCWSNAKTVDYVEKELRNGKVVLAEGDTVLGLLADVSEKGHTQLDHIKGRSKKPYLVLVGDSKKALKFIAKDESKSFQIEKLMNICWPGPATLIFRAKAEGTIALRVPDHVGLLQLLQRFEGLFSTSANLAGGHVPSAVEQVDSTIVDSVACVVMNDVHEKPQSHVPSTIIDCTGERLVVVREGAFDARKLMDMHD